MARDTTIAQRLRNAGLAVVEIDGWQTRGSEMFNPSGSVDHHTAGAGPPRNAPSLGVCINGRADLPGPLCNVLVARDDTCYVIAAGRANHAGKGGWRGLTGNSTVYGVERENVGTTAEPWRPDQTDVAARVHAALIRGRGDSRFVCEHKEWAPGRKSDAHTITGDQMRMLVARHLDGTPPQQGDTMLDKPDRDLLQDARDQAAAGYTIGQEIKAMLYGTTQQKIDAIAAAIKEHKDNPATGGGAGDVDEKALAQELLGALASARVQ